VRLLAGVNHRSRKLLTVVQAIAGITATTASPLEFTQQLSKRLQALAASQDLIIRGNWRVVPVIDLVRSQLAHLGAGSSPTP
jgi:two-component sensor histidine kinase